MCALKADTHKKEFNIFLSGKHIKILLIVPSMYEQNNVTQQKQYQANGRPMNIPDANENG